MTLVDIKDDRIDYKSIALIADRDLLEVRELAISRMCRCVDKGNGDGVKRCVAWIHALCAEMRLRGSQIHRVGP